MPQPAPTIRYHLRHYEDGDIERAIENIDVARKLADEGSGVLDFITEEDWKDKITAKDLSTFSCQQCVLGQVFGSFRGGMEAIEENYPEESEPDEPFDAITVDHLSLTIAYVEILTGERFEHAL